MEHMALLFSAMFWVRRREEEPERGVKKEVEGANSIFLLSKISFELQFLL